MTSTTFLNNNKYFTEISSIYQFFSLYNSILCLYDNKLGSYAPRIKCSCHGQWSVMVTSPSPATALVGVLVWEEGGLNVYSLLYIQFPPMVYGSLNRIKHALIAKPNIPYPMRIRSRFHTITFFQKQPLASPAPAENCWPGRAIERDKSSKRKSNLNRALNCEEVPSLDGGEKN